LFHKLALILINADSKGTISMKFILCNQSFIIFKFKYSGSLRMEKIRCLGNKSTPKIFHTQEESPEQIIDT
jgi:hypothetical protein